jgi:hypothetical protein
MDILEETFSMTVQYFQQAEFMMLAQRQWEAAAIGR